jgi:predicted oxidoreductase
VNGEQDGPGAYRVCEHQGGGRRQTGALQCIGHRGFIVVGQTQRFAKRAARQDALSKWVTSIAFDRDRLRWSLEVTDDYADLISGESGADQIRHGALRQAHVIEHCHYRRHDFVLADLLMTLC